MPRIHATSIGKVVASKIRSLKLLNSILSQLWRGKSGWKTKLLKWNNDCFYVKIEFADSKVCAKMMEKGMWCLNSGALFLSVGLNRKIEGTVSFRPRACG